MFVVGYLSDDGIISEDELEELCGLKYLEVLSLTLKNSRALQCVLSSHKLRSCTQALYLQDWEDSKSLDVSALAGLKHLNRLQIVNCYELKMDYAGVVHNTHQPFVFHSLKKIRIDYCSELKDLTFLAFAPNLKSIEVHFCRDMQEIVCDVPEVMQNLNLFAKLHYLCLSGLSNLQSIYKKPLPFPHLKEMKVFYCHKLKKLPLDSNSAKERKIVIRGSREWWEQLQWENQATQNAFLPCFQSLDGVRY